MGVETSVLCPTSFSPPPSSALQDTFKILVCGHHGAGKTAVTRGFACLPHLAQWSKDAGGEETFQYKDNTQVTVASHSAEGDNIHAYKEYGLYADAVVYVLDPAWLSPRGFNEDIRTCTGANIPDFLMEVLKHYDQQAHFPNIPLLILINKADVQPFPLQLSVIHAVFYTADLQAVREVHVMHASAKTREGLPEALDWLHAASKRARERQQYIHASRALLRRGLQELHNPLPRDVVSLTAEKGAGIIIISSSHSQTVFQPLWEVPVPSSLFQVAYQLAYGVTSLFPFSSVQNFLLSGLLLLLSLMSE
eukprot:g28795.t1